MVAKRIIPCLDVKEGRTVKGINFVGLKDVGDAVELGRHYAREGADELVYLDISATREGRNTFTRLVERIADGINIPFTVGGGISTLDDASRLLDAGADKISINSAAIKDPSLIDRIATAPSVEYNVYLTNREMLEITSPQDMPEPSRIDRIEEPYLTVKVLVPPDYVGAVMDLTIDHRGTFLNMVYLSPTTVEMHWEMPLSELILDYFDQLKSRTKGYASLDYEMDDYREGDLVKLNILLAGEEVDALSSIVFREKAYERGRALCDRLKEVIPRQQFEVAIQAHMGGRIIARSTVKAVRKDVLAKCYGGDISRKRKLLEKQKEGKRRMKSIGTVEVPQEAFLAILKVDDG